MIHPVFGELPPGPRALRDRFEPLGRELDGLLAARASDGLLPTDAWRFLAETGIFGLPVPVVSGGSGGSALDAVAAFEGLGLGCTDLGFLFAANAHLWGAVLPLALHGSPDQIARWLPPLLDGSRVGAHGVTEPGTGSDVRAMVSTVRAVGGGLRIDAHKAFITCAPRAETFVLYLRDGRVDGGPDGAAQLAAVVVERSDGVQTPTQEKLGLRGAPMGEVIVHAVDVPTDRALGAAGAGMAMFSTALEWERACVFAPFVGAMDRQLRRCVRRARTRRQFGQAIGGFQAISHRLADMQTRLDLSRLLLYRAADAKTDGRRAPVEAAQAKLFIAEAFLESSMDALRIHGGAGYLEDSQEAIDLRDALAGPLFSGTSDIQKNIIARFLGV